MAIAMRILIMVKTRVVRMSSVLLDFEEVPHARLFTADHFDAAGHLVHQEGPFFPAGGDPNRGGFDGSVGEDRDADDALIGGVFGAGGLHALDVNAALELVVSKDLVVASGHVGDRKSVV